MMEKLTSWVRAGRRSLRTDRGQRDAGIHEAAILHVDIVGSTRLVEKDLDLAHHRIRQLYARLCRVSQAHRGIVRELRGDAAVVEFVSAEDAIRAALAIQTTNGMLNRSRFGRINPDIRSGISFGTIISDDRMITGLAVIRAQRIEQLAEPGAVLFDQSVVDRLRDPDEFGITRLGRRDLKGFDESVDIYRATSGRAEAWSTLASQLEGSRGGRRKTPQSRPPLLELPAG